MPKELTLKTPVVFALVAALIVSLALNAWRFTRPVEVVTIPTAAGGGGTGASAEAPESAGGRRDESHLSHVPKDPSDAVGPSEAPAAGK
jgi:hypothetical protein